MSKKIIGLLSLVMLSKVSAETEVLENVLTDDVVVNSEDVLADVASEANTVIHADDILIVRSGETVFMGNDDFKQFHLIQGVDGSDAVVQLTEDVEIEHDLKMEGVTVSGMLEVRGVPTGEKHSISTKAAGNLDLVGSVLKNCKVANFRK